ncbi:hypothetical protein LCGC14_1241430 [marine sediment metagenome]|uniref:Uncharacterized protein n=1 Tax=marine sediment metagenome TaxID=412755 RepID=A0A0F9NMU0_9ZZZZ
MKKQIKKWGRSLVISFDEEEQRVYEIKEGSILDLTDMVILNREVRKNGNKK